MPETAVDLVSYWIIVPEIGTDAVASSIRKAWMKGAGQSARYCVAAGMSNSHDTSLHWLHGLNRSTGVAAGRADLNSRLHREPHAAAGESALPPPPPTISTEQARADKARAEKMRADKTRDRDREITRVYNNFLRHKVFEMMREICHYRSRSQFSFMMDADTAVNRTNLELFVNNLDPNAAVYTGLCKRRNTWGNPTQRGVGGGPGILWSRPLLDSICPRLESCAPLRTLMDRLLFAGGDLMLAKCIEFLGHRCTLDKELPYKSGTMREAQKSENEDNLEGINRLDELFRRGPPWVYPPLHGGTILVATRRSAGARAIEMYQRLVNRGSSLTSVISFHRVRPSLRAAGFDKDPRCRIFAEYTRLESGPAHWTSRCLPTFVLIGTPKSGTTSLFNWILQHPDMRAPVRKELHFWAPVLTPDRNCVDRETCLAFKSKSNEEFESSKRPKRWPLTTLVTGKLLTNYLELFPRIDPREFAITGEASPAYMYSPSLALFLESALAVHIKLLIILRDPAERAFSEFKNKRDLMIKGAPKATKWVGGHKKFGSLVAEVSHNTEGCSAQELYMACEPCVRFVTSPNPYWTDASESHGTLTAPTGKPTTAQKRSCVVPPVIWQSWYHLFLPRYMRRQQSVLIEFSDDLSDGSTEMMRRVSSFLGLPSFNFSTSVAYNTEKRRGAYISKSAKSSLSSANTADAAKAESERSTTAESNTMFVRRLMTDSVQKLNSLFDAGQWRPPDQQLRLSIPPAWVERYQVVRTARGPPGG